MTYTGKSITADHPALMKAHHTLDVLSAYLDGMADNAPDSLVQKYARRASEATAELGELVEWGNAPS